MIVKTFPASAPGSQFTAAINNCDASDGAGVLVVDAASSTRPNTQITAIKTDDSANAVEIQDTTGATLAILEAHHDAVTLFRGSDDGAAWEVMSNSSAQDVSTHAAQPIAHGTDGYVVGSNTLAAAISSGLETVPDTVAEEFPELLAEALVEEGLEYNAPEINEIRDTSNHQTVISFAPGTPGTDLNHWTMHSSFDDDALALDVNSPEGGDVGMIFSMSGTGFFDVNTDPAAGIRENNTLVALSTDTEITAVGADIIGLSPDTDEFNDLLAVVREIRTALLASRVGVAP